MKNIHKQNGDIRGRQVRKLPRYYIGNDPFYYDGEKRTLTPVDGLTRSIHLDRFALLDDDSVEVFEGFYHAPSRQPVDYIEKVNQPPPDDVFYLNIMGPRTVDPVGAARKQEADAGDIFLKIIPAQEYRSLLVPLTFKSTDMFATIETVKRKSVIRKKRHSR